MEDHTQVNPNNERRNDNSVLLREFFELKGKLEVMIERYDTVKEDTAEHQRILKGNNGHDGLITLLSNLKNEIKAHRWMIGIVFAGVSVIWAAQLNSGSLLEGLSWLLIKP